MKKQLRLILSDIQVLPSGWIHLTLSGRALPICAPGQFVELAVDRAPVLLNRPFSVYNSTSTELELLVAPLGRASSALAGYTAGETMRVIFPLGHGFSKATHGQKVLLVGGGVGIAPLYYQMLCIKAAGAEPTVIYGMRTAPDETVCRRFAEECNLYICTDDGSEGFHGLVTQHPEFRPADYDLVQICGPLPMMKAAAAVCAAAGTTTEVSLENRMACGLGACLCCVEDTKKGNVCVCKDGPVFNIKELQWQI